MGDTAQAEWPRFGAPARILHSLAQWVDAALRSRFSLLPARDADVPIEGLERRLGGNAAGRRLSKKARGRQFLGRCTQELKE